MTSLSISDDAKWYLVYTKPRQEERARFNLERQGFQLYVPEVKTLRHKSGKWCALVEPLFPSYLFIKLGHNGQNWAPIRSTFGVNNLVRFGQSPATVSKEIINTIQRMTNDCEISEEKIFIAGQKIRVTQGPMAGLDAVFDCLSGTRRAHIFLEFLVQVSRVKVTLDAVVPA